METKKQGRGRPKGSGKDDSQVLAKIADMLVLNPSTRPTAAFKKIVRKPGESYIRRIQAKWQILKPMLLADAELRKSEHEKVELIKNCASHRISNASLAFNKWAYSSSIEGQLHTMQKNLDRAIMPDIKLFKDVHTDLLVKKALNDVYAQMQRDEKNCLTSQICRELDLNPVTRAARGLDSSPMNAIMKAEQRSQLEMARFSSHPTPRG